MMTFHANLRLLRASKSEGRSQERLCAKLYVIEALPRLANEDKGKASLSVDSTTYAAQTQGAQCPLSRNGKLAT